MTTKQPAATAGELEVHDDVEQITITWEGIELVFPAAVDDWDAKALEAFEEGKAITAVNRLLGRRQTNELRNSFREKHGRALKVRDYGALMDDLADAYGFESTGE